MDERYLFRGKQIDGVRPHFITGHYVSVPRPMIVATETRWGGGWDAEDVDLTTVGQCTGLRDRKGTLIFEGDILIEDRNPAPFVYRVGFIQFAFNLFAKDEMPCCGLSMVDRLEIIGNIHDNPELMNVSDSDTKGGK